MKRENILITGGSGYIGSHLTRELADAGHTPVIFDLVSPPQEPGKRIRFIRGNVNSPRDLAACFSAVSPVCVVHLAASPSVSGESGHMGHTRASQKATAESMTDILDAMYAAGCGKIVFASSAAVYADSSVPVSEPETAAQPLSAYGCDKKACEEKLKNAAEAKGMSAVSLRLFNVAGLVGEVPVSDRIEKRDSLITNAVRAAVQGSDLEVFGRAFDTPDGTAIRDYVHIADVTHAFLLAIQSSMNPGQCQVINIGSGRGVSNLEVIREVEGVVRAPVTIVFKPERMTEIPRSTANISRAKSVLGWSPRKSSLRASIQSVYRRYV